MTITTNLNRPATLALAEYILWRTTLPTAPRGLGAIFLDEFGTTVGALFDDGFVVDAEAGVITGAIAGHALTMTQADVASTGRLFWCVQAAYNGLDTTGSRVLSPAPPEVLQGQLVAYVVEVLQGRSLDADAVEYGSLLSMRAQLRRVPPPKLPPAAPIPAFIHACRTTFGPLFEDNPVWSVVYDDFVGLDGQRYSQALITITATGELIQLSYDLEVGWILMTGMISADPVGAAVLPHWAGPGGLFDELVLALDRLRADQPVPTLLNRD
jgi:hypothetical protein